MTMYFQWLYVTIFKLLKSNIHTGICTRVSFNSVVDFCFAVLYVLCAHFNFWFMFQTNLHCHNYFNVLDRILSASLFKLCLHHQILDSEKKIPSTRCCCFQYPMNSTWFLKHQCLNVVVIRFIADNDTI